MKPVAHIQNTELERVVAIAGDLPTVPVVAQKILEMASNERTSAAEMANIISYDPSLGARVLKISNSSYYSCQRQIQSIQQAIVTIGYETLRTIVVAASVKDIYKPFGLAEKILWDHSMGAALSARTICKRKNPGLVDEGFLAGLFHDMGKLIMNKFNKDAYADLTALCYNDTDLEFCEIEKDYFPFSHAQLGACVLKKWNIPETLIYAVLNHHNLAAIKNEEDQLLVQLTAVAAFADLCCKKLGLGEREPHDGLDLTSSEAARILRIDGADVSAILDAIENDYRETKDGFA